MFETNRQMFKFGMCIATVCCNMTVSPQILMNVLLVITLAMLMLTAETLMEASLVHVSLVTLEMG